MLARFATVVGPARPHRFRLPHRFRSTPVGPGDRDAWPMIIHQMRPRAFAEVGIGFAELRWCCDIASLPSPPSAARMPMAPAKLRARARARPGVENLGAKIAKNQRGWGPPHERANFFRQWELDLRQMACPRCGRRCKHVYVDGFACRICLGLDYAIRLLHRSTLSAA